MFKVSSTGLGLGHLPRNFPQGRAFPNVFLPPWRKGQGEKEAGRLGYHGPYPGPLQPEAQG